MGDGAEQASAQQGRGTAPAESGAGQGDKERGGRGPHLLHKVEKCVSRALSHPNDRRTPQVEVEDVLAFLVDHAKTTGTAVSNQLQQDEDLVGHWRAHPRCVLVRGQCPRHVKVSEQSRHGDLCDSRQSTPQQLCSARECAHLRHDTLDGLVVENHSVTDATGILWCRVRRGHGAMQGGTRRRVFQRKAAADILGAL